MADTFTSNNLTQVIIRVLEESAFIFADALGCNEAPPREEFSPVGMSIRYTGPEVGEVHIWAEEDFARYVAANILGLDFDDDTAIEKGTDALKEVLNIVVGNFLTSHYGEGLVFDLGIPVMVEKNVFEKDYDAENKVWIQADDYAVLFTFQHD